MDTNRTDIDMISLDDPGDGAGRKRANLPAYLDRFPATILMLFKLLEGLATVCSAVLGAFLVKTAVSAINQTLQQESIVADIRAMTAQLLTSLQIPEQNIKQVVEVIPSVINFRISGALVSYVFISFLPFALIAALEAIAAVRLRFGKGGTRTLGVLHWIYCIFELVKILVVAVIAVAMSIFTMSSLGFAAGTFLAIIYISLGIFYILVHIPVVLYHHEIAGVMNNIGYEIRTGRRAEVVPGYIRIACIILIIFQIIGAVVSIGFTMDIGARSMLLAAVIGPLYMILKYVCVIINCRNYEQADSSAEGEESEMGSHTPLVILIIVVSLIFIAPTAFLCAMSGRISTAVAEGVSEYVSEAKVTVDKLSEEIDKENARIAESELEKAASAAGAAQKAETEKKAEPVQKTEPAQKAAPAQNAETEKKAVTA